MTLWYCLWYSDAKRNYKKTNIGKIMSNGSAKQKVIQSIKDVTNILVTVSSSPSVDELSAALGLTIFLNKLGKHATAVFSGDIPPAITFLNPDKTFEQTADSLRDFIIALDKEKADHLRYKVVDDAVKIFITPYRTTITDKDLEFSQGDYNVELVLALNVENSESIDTALTAHGKILHDATVVAITAGDVKSGLGSVDWHESNASGVSEMVVELLDDLKTPKVTLDEQMATALLTGIVAVTERFSNSNTSSKVMTTAAELMAAGANQQLVVSKIAESEVEDKPQKIEKIEEKYPEKEEASEDKTEEAEKDEETVHADGTLSISHEKKGDVDEVAEQTAKEKQEESARIAEEKLAKIEPIKEEPQVEEEKPSEKIVSKGELSFEETPLMGGTLNATTTQAAEDKIRELASDQNKTILTHGKYVGDNTPSFGNTPLNAAMGASDEPPKIDPFATTNAAEQKLSTIPVAPQSEESIISAITNDTNQLNNPVAPAPSQPIAPIEPAITNPENSIPGFDLPMPPAMPDFGALPPMPPAPTGVDVNGLPQIAPLGVAPEPVAAPQAPAPAPITAMPTQPAQNADFNPAQFHIPGQ